MSSTDDPSGVTDVSLWQPAGDEYLGTKPKQWFRDGDGRLWLWKESTSNVGVSGEYRKGDDWAEAVAGTKFDGEPSPLAAATEGLSLVSEGAQTHWDDVIGAAPDFADVVEGIADERMGRAARQFAEALYRTNLASLSYLVRRMNP